MTYKSIKNQKFYQKFIMVLGGFFVCFLVSFLTFWIIDDYSFDNVVFLLIFTVLIGLFYLFAHKNQKTPELTHTGHNLIEDISFNLWISTWTVYFTIILIIPVEDRSFKAWILLIIGLIGMVKFLGLNKSKFWIN